jgi:hypothetical protein
MKKMKLKHSEQKIYSPKNPRYNLRPLATTTKDVLHIHDGHDGSCSGGKVVDQLPPLLLLGVVQKLRLHLTEVLAGTQLHGGKDDTGSLPAPYNQCPLTVLHQESLPEASLLHLLVGSHQ